MVDPFEALGIEASFDVDLPALEQRYRDLSRVLHPDRHVRESAGQRRLALGKAIEVGEAWRILRDPIQRAEALLRRAGVAVGEGAEPKADPEFLMDMMEQREALSAVRQSGPSGRVALDRLAVAVRAREAAALAKLSAGFASAAGDGAKLGALMPIVGELRYFRRFLDEVSAAEDDLAGIGAAGAAEKDDHVPV
jgi:molecular chaperone HscB